MAGPLLALGLLPSVRVGLLPEHDSAPLTVRISPRTCQSCSPRSLAPMLFSAHGGCPAERHSTGRSHASSSPAQETLMRA